MKTLSQKFLSGSVLLISLSSLTQAATISWGGAQLTTNYSSDATPLETGSSSSVLFELGIFQMADGSEFVPDKTNYEEWEANWVPFVPATGTDTPGESDYFTPVAGAATAIGQNYFGDVVTMGSDTNEVQSFSTPGNTATELTMGRQVYVWGFNTKSFTMGDDPGPEWLLFTGSSGGSEPSDTNWLVPDSSAAGNDSFTLVWDVFNATEAVVGAIPTDIGEGEMTPPTEMKGPDDVQFATIVPEPGSLVLLLVGSLSLLRRRR